MIITSKNYFLINKRIKDLREKAKLTQADFAEKTGLSINTIALIETDKKQPSSITILKIAKALDIDISYFFQDYLKLKNDCSFLIENQISEEFDKLTITQQRYILQIVVNMIKFLKTSNDDEQ